jgi:hypothetical protein
MALFFSFSLALFRLVFFRSSLHLFFLFSIPYRRGRSPGFSYYHFLIIIWRSATSAGHFTDQQLATLSVQVGYPEQVLASSYLDDFYTAMSVQVNDFLGNILYGVHFLRKVEERILLNPLPEHKWLAYLSKDTITYIPESNRIIIPEHLLLPPFYSVNFPQYVPLILEVLYYSFLFGK